MKDKNLKIKYTDTALEQLEKFKTEQIERLEDYLVRDKYVLGDEAVEITASDIKEAIDNMTVNYRIKNEKKILLKSEALKTASIVYTMLGILITISAFYYESFEKLLAERPTTAKIAMVGIMLTLIGLMLNFVIRRREKEMRDNEKRPNITKIENNYFEN